MGPDNAHAGRSVAWGFYEPGDFPGHYRGHQTLTIGELFEGRKIQLPEHGVETFAKAERKTRREQEESF